MVTTDDGFVSAHSLGIQLSHTAMHRECHGTCRMLSLHDYGQQLQDRLSRHMRPSGAYTMASMM